MGVSDSGLIFEVDIVVVNSLVVQGVVEVSTLANIFRASPNELQWDFDIQPQHDYLGATRRQHRFKNGYDYNK